MRSRSFIGIVLPAGQRADNTYTNVHTSQDRAGEIHGQIFRAGLGANTVRPTWAPGRR